MSVEEVATAVEAGECPKALDLVESCIAGLHAQLDGFRLRAEQLEDTEAIAELAQLNEELSELESETEEATARVLTITERRHASHPADCDCDACRWVRKRSES